MDFDTLKAAIEQSDELSDFVVSFGQTEDNHLCINGFVALEVPFIAQHIASDQDVEIIDENGDVLGYLCLTKKLGQVNFQAITEAKQIAYLAKVDDYSDDFLIGNFKSDYFVVSVKRLKDYKENYMGSSSLWGGFEGQSTLSFTAYKKTTDRINARRGIDLPTDSHKLVAVSSTLDQFSLERYLKLYHLLELGFDWNIVTTIRALNDDLKGIGKILSSYGRDDIDLLKSLIVSKCTDITALENKMSKAFDAQFYNKVIEIFFEYEKESNPIKADRLDKFNALKATGTLTFENAKSAGLTSKIEDYNLLVKKLAAYWIYRTRCGIAHHRIGEYIITLDDEFFIVDFMEPLIREVLLQVFKQ